MYAGVGPAYCVRGSYAIFLSPFRSRRSRLQSPEIRRRVVTGPLHAVHSPAPSGPAVSEDVIYL